MDFHAGIVSKSWLEVLPFQSVQWPSMDAFPQLSSIQLSLVVKLQRNKPKVWSPMPVY